MGSRVTCGAILALLLAAPFPGAAAAPGAEWVTLGTGGGPVIRAARSEPANALVVGEDVYLFDLGAGTQRRLAEAGIAPARVRGIFLSHLHVDHTGDLAPFLIGRWVLNDYRPLPVIGPPGTAASLAAIAALAEPVRLAPVTIGGPAKPAFAAGQSATDLAGDTPRPVVVFEQPGIRVSMVLNAHYHFAPGSPEAEAARSYAFRIEAGGRAIVYTGDTGMSEAVVDLARGADLLVSEVIDMAGTEATLRRAGVVPPAVLPALLAHMREDHLTPEQVGEIASRAGVGKVVLTHLVPGNDGERSVAPYRAGVAARFRGPVLVARDLDHF